jgi:predicted GNAT family acetyltransferase
MGVTCRIVRDSNGNINYLETNDGQRSNLFDNLRSLYGTEKALEYYALTESENFKDVQEVKKEDFTFSGQETLNKLEETGLADNVYQMTSEEIEAKLIELGVEADVARQVVAYHGSPYSFDRFTTNAMGTGEGAQAFGWGLYFTDLESIARNYANSLAKVTLKGETKGYSSSEIGDAISIVELSGSKQKSVENLQNIIEETKTALQENPNNIFKKKGLDKNIRLLEVLKNLDIVVERNLYKVSLHKGKTPSEYTWLEWDKPLNKEIKGRIKQVLKNRGIDYIKPSYTQTSWVNGEKKEKVIPEKNFVKDSMTGQDLYESIALQFKGKLSDVQQEASLLLLEAGVDGVKYPAESISRGATSDTARGFNYVVFDENAITIEEQIQFQKAGIDKITNGFVVGKDVYLNKDTATEDTQIHEFNHLYQKQLKSERPEVYKKGLDLIKVELVKNNSEIKDVIDFVKTSQPDLEGEKLFEEILTELVGRKGLELLIKEKNKAKSSGIIDWLSEVWKEIKSMLGISSMSDEEVLKLNLEDFTKASATDLLSGSKLSKKETVKIEKNEVNGKLVYEPFFKGKKMGALRLLPYSGGYRVDSVIVYDKFQKKGVAKNLYKYAINDLSKQGISLSSLNVRAPYAEKIWEGLVNEGIATKDGNDYRAFREPKVSDVLEYANETEEPLTKEQSVQAIDTLASFGINNSLELFEKLKEAFVKDGAIVFDRKKLEKAGYNSYEITSILTNRDLQQQIKENIYKVKNTDLSIDLEGLEVLKTDEVNIFGRQTAYVKSEREAVSEIVDGEIKRKKTDTLQTLNKTYPKTLPEIDTRPFETVLKVTENVAKRNPEKLKKVSQAMQEEALKYGVDLRGIENKIYPIQRLKSFTESLVNYISEPNNNFSEVYDKFFEVSQLPKAENEGNDIKLDTELSEYELFRDHNLVRKEGNTYTKVSPENIEDLYNYFLRQQNGKQSNTEQRDRTRWNSSRGNQTLEGAPIVEGITGADPELTYWAEEYAKRNNIPYKRQSSYVEVDEGRAKRIAEAYDKMEHNPSDPKVKEAFQNLINQTIAQYRILEEAGYKFYLFDETNDPYNGNPYNAMRDLRSNKVMGSFATEAGFGSGATEINVEDNPMLQDTGIRWGYGSVEGEQKIVLANDLFRTVHDAFGHGLEGSGFRARGEENAWQAHARLFTGSALGAITSETRGQNSWLNYGKYAEQNRTAKVEDTIFADQKTGLMPEWTWTEGFDKGKEAEFKTKEDIQARTPELEVEDYQTDSDVLEALFIWKNFLGYPVKTKSNKKAPFKGMTKNPFKVVTADGIVLKNNDTLTRAKADLYEEDVVKEDVDYQDEVREKISLGEITPEKIKTDYTIIEDGVLMTKNNTNQFLRTPLANYELIYQDGNLSFYKDVLGAEKNLSDIDFTKYFNESVKPDNYIVAKNNYSKQELEEINNKYFSCK